MNEGNPNTNVLVFIPPLVTMLCHTEKMLDRPMTEIEVFTVRDNAAQVRTAPRHARGPR